MEIQPLNIKELRDILAKEIQKLNSGETHPAHVTAITGAAGKIIAAARLEMEYCKAVGVVPDIDFIPKPKRGPAQ